ncbi:MAG TPA: FlgD immunoglobulin-like domain containing protein [bacterium]|nr:FlgD immunoglobulin-like domain containing protein [bacterium]
MNARYAVLAICAAMIAGLPGLVPVAGGATATRALPAADVEISGEPSAWYPINAKALDPVYDGTTGRAARGDLMGFYFDQGVRELSMRVNLYRPPTAPASQPLLAEGVRVYVLMDYAPGGSTALPAGIKGSAPFAWDRAVELREVAGKLQASVLDFQMNDTETALVDRVIAPARWPSLEASLALPAGFKQAVARSLGEDDSNYPAIAEQAAASEATPINFYVFTAADGQVLDNLVASNAPLSNTHNVAFVQHLNQGLSYTNVFRGDRGEHAAYDGDPANPDDGADELLAAHDYYNLPVNWHQGGLLVSAAEWHDPTFNDWLATGVAAGRYEMVTSALGQHMMPFVRDEINGKAVSVETNMIQTFYGYTPRVAWVPERVWCENPDNDGNGTDAAANVIDYIGDDFSDNGVWAVILDDYIHCGYRNGPLDDHHIYTYKGIKVLPIDNDFVGQVNWDAGAAWNTIIAGTSDEIIIYGNDAEVAAEVMQGASNPNALNNYIWILQQCSANSATVGVWKLTSVLQDAGFTTQSLLLQNGTYGSLGGFAGYGGSDNSWYGDWAGYTGASNLDNHTPKWNYGTQWDHTLTKILAAPANNLSEMAWYVLMTNLHETGWHDSGEISGWENHYSNHIRMGNAHAEAARWAAGLYANPTGAYAADFDDDGSTELVMYNDRILAVFDPNGGKLQWLFAKGTGYNYSVVSNDNVYWADTDGDYNETNHVAALSDVSIAGIDRENDLYSFQVVTGSGTTVQAKIINPAVTKTVFLTLGDPYLKVQYRTGGERAYVKNGFTPDNLNLTWAGKALYRVWDPDGGGYFGQKNTNTNATAAVVVGTAGAHHNLQFSATLLEGDEFYGDAPFEVYVYGGYTSAVDGSGHIPELKALRNALVDRMAPMPLSGIEYPSTNVLVLNFDEAVNTSTVVKTGIGFCNDEDGIAEVSLTSSDVLTTTGYNKRLSFNLSSATAAALEALTGNVELLLATNTVKDAAANGNAAVTNLDNVPVTFAPATTITIDGSVSDADWACAEARLNDLWDSSWNGTAPGDTNEILALFADWDSTYLYLGIRGYVHGNSWLLYLDTDVDGPNGFTDLTAIDTWERGAIFTAAGFKPDYEYGAYQHQGAYDSEGMWKILSATTTQNISPQIYMAFDPQHVYGYTGGSELAIPWDVLYGLGAGHVPTGCKIGIVASLCWDPEPSGELGGDVAPNNISATLPTVDNFLRIVVDADSNGVPDRGRTAGVPDVGLHAASCVLSAYPSPTASIVRVPCVIAGLAGQARCQVRAEVFDISGRMVQTVFNGELDPGEHAFQWDGTTRAGESAPAGIYFMRITADGTAIGAAKFARVR